MISVYKDADFLAAYKQKKKILWAYLAVTAVYLAFCIGWLIYYIGLPYKHPHQTLVKACIYVASALFVVFSVPYLAIKYSRIKRYFRMLSYVSEGLKNEEKNYFYTFAEKSLQKDNIDVESCIFETWSKKKQEWLEREAYRDLEVEQLPFESGDFVRYIVQSNFIIQYEILQKKALEFEEVEDEEDETDAEYEGEETEVEEQVEDQIEG